MPSTGFVTVTYSSIPLPFARLSPSYPTAGSAYAYRAEQADLGRPSTIAASIASLLLTAVTAWEVAERAAKERRARKESAK